MSKPGKFPLISTHYKGQRYNLTLPFYRKGTVRFYFERGEGGLTTTPLTPPQRNKKKQNETERNGTKPKIKTKLKNKKREKDTQK